MVAQSGSSVLVVEDFDDTREMMKIMLEMRGCRVLEAADGQKAVEVATREKPDLILMDLNLPVLDGYAATRHLHNQEETQMIPIVAFSAQCANDRVARALEAGCLDCVAKPVDFNLLDRLLEQYLPQSR
jgi:two-component system, cell cycle response regulator DivK